MTLERQLNKSVLIGWSPPEPCGYNLIDSYHVYVDGVLKVTVKANERTRALIEGVDSNRVSLNCLNFKIHLNFNKFYFSFTFVSLIALVYVVLHKIANNHEMLLVP